MEHVFDSFIFKFQVYFRKSFSQLLFHLVYYLITISSCCNLSVDNNTIFCSSYFSIIRRNTGLVVLVEIMSQQEMIYVFLFNDQLPRIFKVVKAIITVEPTVLSYRKGRPESFNRQSVINSWAKNLKRLWEQSLGTNFTKIIRTIQCQIGKILGDYVKFMKRHSQKSNRKMTKL